MFANALVSEQAAVVATIDPDAYGAGAQSSDYVDMSKFHSLVAILQAGDIAGGGTIAFKLQSAAAASGGADITGKAITTFTQTPTDRSNKQAIINLRADELPEGHRFVKAVMTVATGADCGAILLGFWPRNGKASDQDLASVDEIVE